VTACAGLCDRLCSEVRGADRVRVRDDVGTPVLVTADGERQTEGEDQPYHSEQSALEDADGFAIPVGVRTEVAAGDDAEGGCAADHTEDEEPELPAREREEHGDRKLGESADDDEAHRHVVLGDFPAKRSAIQSTT
jgi:hypothetical protein